MQLTRVHVFANIVRVWLSTYAFGFVAAREKSDDKHLVGVGQRCGATYIGGHREGLRVGVFGGSMGSFRRRVKYNNNNYLLRKPLGIIN